MVTDHGFVCQLELSFQSLLRTANGGSVKGLNIELSKPMHMDLFHPMRHQIARFRLFLLIKTHENGFTSSYEALKSVISIIFDYVASGSFDLQRCETRTTTICP